ncbi:MAG: hypothetical protein JXB07_20505, partial [Anaerolineae bacterium]|nr:hypothetical protein [Anaerolineae bacterium]
MDDNHEVDFIGNSHIMHKNGTTITVNLRSFTIWIDGQQIWQAEKKIGMFLKKIKKFSGMYHAVGT